MREFPFNDDPEATVFFSANSAPRFTPRLKEMTRHVRSPVFSELAESLQNWTLARFSLYQPIGPLACQLIF